MGQVNPDDQLEIEDGVFKRLGDCSGPEIEGAIGLIATRRIKKAWIAEQTDDPNQGAPMIARRFFAHTTEPERDLIAYWHMVKLVDEAYRRYTSGD